MCYFPTVPLLGRDSAFLGLLSQLSSIYLSSSLQNFGAMVPFSHSQLFFFGGTRVCTQDFVQSWCSIA
jgi:hypothetical protein